MPADDDDRILFERIVHNDADALGVIMRRYGSSLCSFAFRIIGDTQAAEDIAQEVFIRLWEKRRSLSPKPSLRNYLYLSARHLALNHVRDTQIHLAHAESYRIEQLMSQFVVEEERYRLLAEAIEKLPPRTAEVIRFTRDGLSQEEIANKMGIAIATVKLLKSRGIQKLKEILGPLSILLPFFHLA